MKILFLIPALVCTIVSHAQQTDSLFFETERELFDYTFQNTDLDARTDGLLLDYWRYPDSAQIMLDEIANTNPQKSDYVYSIGNLFDRMAVQNDFDRESLFHPFFDHLQSLDHVRTMRIPIIIYDTKISRLKNIARNQMENWTNITPFPAFNQSDFISTDYFYASTLTDSIAYENVVFYFDQNTILSNTDRNLEYINIVKNGTTQTLYAGDEYDVTNWSGTNSVTFEYVFDDGSSEIVNQVFERTIPIIEAKGLDGFYSQDPIVVGGLGNEITIDNPELQYAIKYGCETGKILKPFILVAGWGTHTDLQNVNDAFNWPTLLMDWTQSINEAGYLENLIEQGYDVIVAKFYPPNASILKNAVLLEQLIREVNIEKMANGSYEENIINGYSAGALCVKHTLLAMEKKYLSSQGPHHHTKLFISFDGENQGANIPLGIQHHVQHLWNEQYTNTTTPLGKGVYALNYILNAPLSKELLAYFHTETGDSNNPGQGKNIMRTWYLNDQASNNHEWNPHIPGYPAFCRNISISNGSSTPDINFSTYESNHYPYIPESGATYFKQNNLNRRWEANFLTHGNSLVFNYEKKAVFSANWQIQNRAVTLNMPVLDNAPGGTMFVNNNPIIALNKITKWTITGLVDIAIDAQYCFTPTVYTHDIKTFDPFADGGLGYMNFDFKEEKLNYSNETDAGGNIYSNTIGYPHLGYPNNHYDVTSFDALFTWDNNTEHVTASKIGINNEGRFVPLWTDIKNVIKNFMVNEAEPAFIFLQNDHIGEEGSYFVPYRVDYNADEEIYFGNHVTQKTDFKEITLENHAIVKSMAGSAIYIKDGFHAKPGTEWHAFIGEEFCTKSMGTGSSSSGTNSENTAQGNLDRSSKEMLIVPNPTSNEVSFLIDNEIDNETFSYYLTDLSGQQVMQGKSSEGESIALFLKAGIYIVTLKTKTTWYTEKIIIQ